MNTDTGTEELIFSEESLDQTSGNETTAVDKTHEQDTAEETSSESTDSNESKADDIADFLAKKGVDLNDPEATRKVAEMYRNVEKEFYKRSQEKAQLEREISQHSVAGSPDMQALAEVKAMRAEMEAAKWKQEVNLSPEAEQKMLDYMNQPLVGTNGQILINPETGQPLTKGLMVVNGQLSLNDVYNIVGGDSPKIDSMKDSLKNEIRKEIEARQASKRPNMQASNSTEFGDKGEPDPFLEGLME